MWFTMQLKLTNTNSDWSLHCILFVLDNSITCCSLLKNKHLDFSCVTYEFMCSDLLDETDGCQGHCHSAYHHTQRDHNCRL